MQKHFEKPSLTQENLSEETNINTIMSRYKKTGVLPEKNGMEPRYGDFTGYQDYHQSMNAILKAQDSFMTIPAEIRARFGNDPGKFLEFCQNPDNQDEMIDMGLAERVEPDPVHPATDPNPRPSNEPQTPLADSLAPAGAELPLFPDKPTEKS